jgi:D-alanyl-lipoteichoic acid acyltransferase DltB (MBOAT superfamily)
LLFPTIDFAIFFVVVFTASWILRPWPRAWRVMILVASYVFYGWWNWHFTFLLAASTVINQTGALLTSRLPDPRQRRWAMVGTVVADVALLGWFKYYGFFAVNVANGLHRVGVHSPLPILQVALPVGISFFTFMGISYVVDVYRGKIEAAGWLDAAVYLSFFPHLVAGPIVRGSELIPQLRAPRDPRRVDASRAAWLIMAGLAKKVVISSFLSKHIVDPVFAVPHQHSALEVLFAVYGYAVQIYADFSGYTDIAIGVALLLGFKFPENFNAPYTAESLQDFWRRWHITLSMWLRDYVYIPLGGNRGGRWRTARNVMLTMLIGGLWHGAAWTFVAWGALHGGGQVVGMLKRDRAEARRRRGAAGGGQTGEAAGGAAGGAGGGGPTGSGPTGGGPTGEAAGGWAAAAVTSGAGVAGSELSPTGDVLLVVPREADLERAPSEASRGTARIWLRRIVTFHLVCLGWVLFRATSFANALAVLSRFAHPGAAPLVTPLVVGAIVVSIASQYVPSDVVAGAQRRFANLTPLAQGAVLAGGLYVITTLAPQGVAPFIYYRF